MIYTATELLELAESKGFTFAPFEEMPSLRRNLNHYVRVYGGEGSANRIKPTEEVVGTINIAPTIDNNVYATILLFTSHNIGGIGGWTKLFLYGVCDGKAYDLNLEQIIDILEGFPDKNVI